MDGAGKGFTMAVVVVDEAHPLEFVTVTLYVPEAAIVALLITGFCSDELKLLGPFQEKLVPPLEESASMLPVHIGLLLEVLTDGNGLTVTAIALEFALQLPFKTTQV